jgi:hypothetical protein
MGCPFFEREFFMSESCTNLLSDIKTAAIADSPHLFVALGNESYGKRPEAELAMLSIRKPDGPNDPATSG